MPTFPDTYAVVREIFLAWQVATDTIMETIAQDGLLSTAEKVKHKRHLETLRYVLKA